MSGYDNLIQRWRGMSYDDIARGWTSGDDPTQIVEKEKTQLQDACLQGVIKGATSGDIEAISWLEERNLITLPDFRARAGTPDAPAASGGEGRGG